MFKCVQLGYFLKMKQTKDHLLHSILSFSNKVKKKNSIILLKTHREEILLIHFWNIFSKKKTVLHHPVDIWDQDVRNDRSQNQKNEAVSILFQSNLNIDYKNCSLNSWIYYDNRYFKYLPIVAKLVGTSNNLQGLKGLWILTWKRQRIL